MSSPNIMNVFCGGFQPLVAYSDTLSEKGEAYFRRSLDVLKSNVAVYFTDDSAQHQNEMDAYLHPDENHQEYEELVAEWTQTSLHSSLVQGAINDTLDYLDTKDEPFRASNLLHYFWTREMPSDDVDSVKRVSALYTRQLKHNPQNAILMKEIYQGVFEQFRLAQFDMLTPQERIWKLYAIENEAYVFAHKDYDADMSMDAVSFDYMKNILDGFQKGGVEKYDSSNGVGLIEGRILYHTLDQAKGMIYYEMSDEDITYQDYVHIIEQKSGLIDLPLHHRYAPYYNEKCNETLVELTEPESVYKYFSFEDMIYNKEMTEESRKSFDQHVQNTFDACADASGLPRMDLAEVRKLIKQNSVPKF